MRNTYHLRNGVTPKSLAGQFKNGLVMRSTCRFSTHLSTLNWSEIK